MQSYWCTRFNKQSNHLKNKEKICRKVGKKVKEGKREKQKSEQNRVEKNHHTTSWADTRSKPKIIIYYKIKERKDK